jgi:GxxExxY protein
LRSSRPLREIIVFSRKARKARRERCNIEINTGALLCDLCVLCVKIVPKGWKNVKKHLSTCHPNIFGQKYGMHENEISRIIVDRAFQVHNTLGPGLLESVYRSALAYELVKSKLNVVVERPIPAIYEEVRLELGFRADIMVENRVIVETKSIEALAPIHSKSPSHLPPSRGCATWSFDQFQRGTDKKWDQTGC